MDDSSDKIPDAAPDSAQRHRHRPVLVGVGVLVLLAIGWVWVSRKPAAAAGPASAHNAIAVETAYAERYRLTIW